MADPTDAPRSAAVPFPVSSAPARTDAPSPPPAETGEQREYRPLAILAIVGLGVAVLYAICMAIAAGVAFYQNRPLILPMWSSVVPLGGAALALIAWLQIQRSEGALGGRKLALWGAALCMVVGLVYWSYYLATYLAIRQGAEAVSRSWIENVSRGNLQTAYWNILNPNVRPSLPADAEHDLAYRNALEFRFNVGGEAGAATLTQFCRRDEIHFLRQAGSDLKIEPLGVISWDYSGTGYVVRQAYRFTAPAGTLEMEMILHGDEAKHGEFVGRQWYLEPLSLTIVPESIRLSSEGQRAAALGNNARAFFENWATKLGFAPIVAYPDTLPVAERAELHRKIIEREAIADCMLFAATPCSPGYGSWISLRAATLKYEKLLGDALPGFKEFTEGSLVHADRNLFWVPLEGKKPDEPDFKESFAKKQDEVEKEVKALFAHPAADFGQTIETNRGAHMLLTRHENGVFSVDLEFSISVSDSKAVEGLLVMECTDAQIAEGPPIQWRVARMELLRVKPQAGGPPGMRGRPRPGLQRIPSPP
jgi:hypothetical protein